MCCFYESVGQIMAKLGGGAAVATSAPLTSAPLARFLRPADPQLSACHDALWDLKHAIALQCVFVAGVCRRLREIGTDTSAAQTNKAPDQRAKELIVGILGGGVIGGVVGHALIDAGLPAASVLMSTRSPRRQKELTARGVNVVFDNAAVASRARLLIIAVLPGQQLQDVARTARPGPNTLVLSLVGSTPLAKMRSLLGVPNVIGSAADATLPLLIEAQSQRAMEMEEMAEEQLAAIGGPLSAVGALGGRLPDGQVLRLAATGFAPRMGAVTAVLSALPVILTDFEFPMAIARELCQVAYFGKLSRDALASIAVDVATYESKVEAGGAERLRDHRALEAADGSEEHYQDVLLRARAAFEARCAGARSEGELPA